MPSNNVWYCCRCGDGPLNLEIIDVCPICSEKRCPDCSEEKISSRAAFSSMSGEPDLGVNPYPGVSQTMLSNKNTIGSSRYMSGSFNCYHRLNILFSLALSQTPSIVHPIVHNRLSIKDIIYGGGNINNHPHVWYCCQCGDGPKLAVNNVICTECEHGPCGDGGNINLHSSSRTRIVSNQSAYAPRQ